MKYPVEDLALCMSHLQEKLDPNSSFYFDFDTINTELWQYIGKPEEIPLLIRLQHFLNQEGIVKILTESKNRKLLEQIHLIILQELKDNITRQFNHKKSKDKIEEETFPSYWNTTSFVFIAIFGTIFAAVEGASIIQAFIGSLATFVQISTSIAIPLQLAFAVFSVLAFYLFELSTLGKPLGITTLEVGIVFKFYAKQSKEYQNTLSLIESIVLTQDLNSNELGYLEMAYGYLMHSHQEFEERIKEVKKIQFEPSCCKTIIKNICTGIGALVCATIAAVGAYSCVTQLLPLIFISAIASGPVGLSITLAIVAICFIAAASIYIHLERKALTNLVNWLFGTPEKSITKLIKREDKIEMKKENVNNLIDLKKDNHRLQEKCRQTNSRTTSKTESKIDPILFDWKKLKSRAHSTPAYETKHKQSTLRSKETERPSFEPNQFRYITVK